MNWFLRGALSLVLAASAGVALAQPYGPPPAGHPGPHGPPLAGAAPDVAPPRMRDDMPGPDRRIGPPRDGRMMGHGGHMMGREGCRQDGYYRCGYDLYGFSRQGLTRDGYDIFGYDADGFDRYGFDVEGFTRDGYDRFGYDQNGLDRYGRRAPTRYGQAAPDREPGPERDRAGPPPMRYGQGGPGQVVHPNLDRDRYDGYREGQYSYERYSYGERAPDRYGPPPRDYWDEPADGYYVPSFGGPLQHYADPRCNTCRVTTRDCGCHGDHVGMSSISVSPHVFYDGGGVGPIPDGGSYGGGGYVIMGGRAGASSSASASAYASSSSRVSVSVRGGGHRGGCNSCGGHR